MFLNLCVFNFRLSVRNTRRNWAGAPHDAACHVGSWSVSVSVGIHCCHDQNLQEAQEVSLSVFDLQQKAI